MNRSNQEHLPVDLRSDTVTRPSAAMLDAMLRAPLGDDVFDDDPTVHALEERVARLVDKEAAVYVPSGTMANQLALRVHTRSGDDVIAHRRSHLFNYESGAPAALAGVTVRPIDSSDGTLALDEVLATISLTDDPHFAPTTLLCFENTHNGCGGTIVPRAHMAEVVEAVQRLGLAAHLDGARLLNAAVASGSSAAALAAGFDTVSLCFSKGLGAPVGSVLAGSTAHIARARRFRKMYGGGMRQAGIIAAAALYALDHHVERLADDHRRAQVLVQALSELRGVLVDGARAQTNLVYFELAADHPAHQSEDPTSVLKALEAEGLRVVGDNKRMRAVLHLDVDDGALERAIAALRRVLG